MIEKSITINRLELKNRLVMPPMATGKSMENGSVTEELCEYYEERAKYSGIGLIITEHCYIHPQGKAGEGQLSVSADADMEGLKKLADGIHRHGVKVFVQISHAGSDTVSKVTGEAIVGASAVVHPRQKDQENIPHELTIPEMNRITELFAQAAQRVKKAGFDGVEIHAAHGYLLNQFYSPLTNRRSDAYGVQSVESRMRLIVEVLRAVRAEVGEEYPIAVRLGGCDYTVGGSTIGDSIEAAVILERAGADLLDVTGGIFGFVKSEKKDAGYFRDMTYEIKKHVSIPVLLTGGVTKEAEAETLLQAQAGDLIGVGRAIYKDAQWMKK